MAACRVDVKANTRPTRVNNIQINQQHAMKTLEALWQAITRERRGQVAERKSFQMKTNKSTAK